VLISRRRDRLQLVTHPDHGRVAGELGEAWGNDRFTSPAARDALLDAAAHHDDGWAELDDLPVFNPEARRPAHFLEVPLTDTVGPYGRGVDSVYARSPHAGAIVSMHWAGLYRTRWGLQGGDPVGHPATAEIVASQERRWIAALRDAWDLRGLRSEFEAETWHAYEILQALDFLSLAICLLDLAQPVGGEEAAPMPRTLPHVDQPPGGRMIPNVPMGRGGDRVDLRIWVTGPGQLAVDPYPFAGALQLELPLREMADRPYEGAEAAAAAFHEAPLVARSVRVAPA
jgi:hypothetical protein